MVTKRGILRTEHASQNLDEKTDFGFYLEILGSVGLKQIRNTLYNYIEY